MKFTVQAQIVELPPFDDKRNLEVFTDEVEAENFSSAKERAKILVWDRCQQLRQQRGIIAGYDFNNVRVNFKSDAPAATEQIIRLLKHHLELAMKNETDLAKTLSHANEFERAVTENKLQFAGGQKYALECLLSEITGVKVVR